MFTFGHSVAYSAVIIVIIIITSAITQEYHHNIVAYRWYLYAQDTGYDESVHTIKWCTRILPWPSYIVVVVTVWPAYRTRRNFWKYRVMVNESIDNVSATPRRKDVQISNMSRKLYYTREFCITKRFETRSTVIFPVLKKNIFNYWSDLLLMDESFSSKYKLLGTVLNINVIIIFIKRLNEITLTCMLY